MSALDYFKDVVFNKYAQFSGRARRKEYWYFVLVSALINLSLFGLGAGLKLEILMWIYMLISLLLIIPNLAVSIRRLHDTGRSGWHLLWSFLPLIGTIILLVFFTKDSEPGNNQYGPNPKTGDTEDGFFENLITGE